jgi:hypothetical protein
MKLFVTLTALVLAGAAVSGDADVESDTAELMDSDIGIDIGRLGVLNERTSTIWQKMRSDETSTDRRDLRDMNYNLRRTVWEYNLLREDLCNDRFVVEQSCGAPFVPKWVYQKNATTWQELRAREGDLNVRIYALWDAACERLEKVISHDDWMPYCSIE